MLLVLSTSKSKCWGIIEGKINAEKVDSASDVPSINFSGVVREEVKVEQLQQLIENNDFGMTCVFFQSAAYYVAEEIQRGVSLNEALLEWIGIHSRILEIVTLYRKKVMLLPLNESLRYPLDAHKEFIASGLDISEFEKVEGIHDIPYFIALISTSQNQRASRVNDLILAASHFSPDKSSDLTNIYEEYLDLKSVRNERDNLSESLEKKQEEISFLEGVVARIEKSSHENVKKISELTGENKYLEMKLKEIDEDSSKLLEQLHYTQSLLEEETISKKKILDKNKNELGSLNLLIRKKNEEEKILKKSFEDELVKSESLVEKLKLDILELDKENLRKTKLVSEAALENQLLVQQLHNTQEMLESYIEKERNNKIKLKKFENEIKKIENKNRNISADLASKNYRVEVLNKKINGMENSLIWKTAAPARSLFDFLNKTKKQREELENQIELILASEYFDAEWYLSCNLDVAESAISPAEHYLVYGFKEGRDPSAVFNNNWYLEAYPDVIESGMNPLLHYTKFGKSEGRTASPKLLEDKSQSGK